MFGVELVLTSYSGRGLPECGLRHAELVLLAEEPALEVGGSG
jgi:hypothetical protein